MGSLNPENPPKQELDDSGYVHEDATVKEVPPESTGPNLLDLSDDVLLYILQYCPPLDLKALGYTCTRLGTLILDRTLWQSVDARSEPSSRRRLHWLLTHALSANTTALRLSGYAKEQPARFIPVHTFCPYHPFPLSCSCVPHSSTPRAEQGKTLPDSKTLSYAALFRLTQLCTNLTELILEDIVIDSRVTRIGMFPISLRKLSLKGSKCIYPEEHFLDKIYDHLPYLEDIDLSHCNWLEPSCMLPLSKLLRLCRLVLQHCPKLGEFTAYASLAARYGFKTLKILDFCGSPVGDSEVSAFGLVPNLEELYLSPAEEQKIEEELPVLAELLPWEEEEPEYYSSKYATEQWIQDEANPGSVPNRIPRCTSALYPTFQHNDSPVPCSACHQPVTNRYCPIYPHLRIMNHENDRNQAGNSRNEEESSRNVEEISRNGEESSQNGEESTRNEEESAQNGTGSDGNESDSSMCKNFDESDTMQHNDGENNIEAERNDKGNKRKYEESNNGKKENEREDTFTKRSRIGEVNNFDGSEASSSKNLVNCSDNQAGCSINQPGCSENQAGCSENQAGCSKNETGCSKNQAECFDNQAGCSKIQAGCSKNQAGCFHKEVGSAREESSPTIRVSCSNGAPTIIEVDLFKNRVNTSQHVTNNNVNVSRIQVNLSMNRPSTSGEHAKFGIKPIFLNAESSSTIESSKVVPSWSKVEPSCSKVEPSCSKVELNSETEVTSSNDSKAECNDDIKIDKNERDVAENKTSKTNKRHNIFKESISEFKRRLLSSKIESNENDETCQNDDTKDDTESTDDNDSPKAKKTKQDSKSNEVKKKLDYRDPKNNDICSDTSSNYDDDDDDDDTEPKIRRPKKQQELKVTSNNWIRYPEKRQSENVSKEPKKNVTCQMIDNIRRRHELRRNRTPNVQRAGNLRNLGANRTGPYNRPADNQRRARFVRFRNNQPAVVIECSREPNEGSDDNHNDARQRDWHNVAAGPNPPAAIILPAQEGQNVEPQSRVLYVNVGRQRQAIYRAAEAYRANIAANYPISYYFPPTHVSHNSLVTDLSIRRFGRADNENINYVQIGPRGMVPINDPGSRPDRSNLRVLSVRGFTNVTDRSLIHLVTAAPNLRLVDFSGTSVTEQGATQFRCARPDCEVRCGPIDDSFGNEIQPESR